MRYGVTARRKRNVRRMAGLCRPAPGQARGQEGGRRGQDQRRRGQGFRQAGGRGGKCRRKASATAPIVKNLSLRVLRGDRLALVGPNGAGKTTLINLLTGVLEPDSGTIRLGTNLQMATLDQRRAALDPNATLADTLTGGGSDWVEINGEKKHVIGYMKDFLFAPEQARTPTGKLSGGERARLLLARALSLPSNFLVLDEPTNDLDLETLDLLQEMLGDYPGTILLVSHDRDFLDRVAGSVLVCGRRRQVDRICRRLQRHGRAARLRPERRRSRPRRREQAKPAEKKRARRRARTRGAG